MAYTPITPVDVTPGTTGSWQDIDASSYIAEGATGVCCHVVVTVDDNKRGGIRKNGSTDSFEGPLQNASHHWGFCGVDGSRIFEGYVGSSVEIWLVGYFDSDATFFTNATQKTPGGYGSYQDINISSDTGGDTAIAAILVYSSVGSTRQVFSRKNGTSTQLHDSIKGIMYQITGVDGSEIFETYLSSSSVGLYVTGYIVDGVTIHDSPYNRSIGSTGTWTDLTALSASAVAGLYWTNAAESYTGGWRKNGSSENIQQKVDDAIMVCVECDASGIVEHIISNTDVDCYELGFFQTSAIELSADDIEQAHQIAGATQVHTHIVSPTGLEHVNEMSTVAVDISPLVAAGLEHTNELAQAEISGGDDVLEIAGLEHANEVGTTSIVWAGELTTANLEHTHALGSASLDTYTLATNGVSHAQELSAPSLAQFHVLSPNALTHLNNLGVASLATPDPITNAVFLFQYAVEFEVVGPPPSPPAPPST